jgi:hypothetical protein
MLYRARIGDGNGTPRPAPAPPVGYAVHIGRTYRRNVLGDVSAAGRGQQLVCGLTRCVSQYATRLRRPPSQRDPAARRRIEDAFG